MTKKRNKHKSLSKSCSKDRWELSSVESLTSPKAKLTTYVVAAEDGKNGKKDFHSSDGSSFYSANSELKDVKKANQFSLLSSGSPTETPAFLTEKGVDVFSDLSSCSQMSQKAQSLDELRGRRRCESFSECSSQRQKKWDMPVDDYSNGFKVFRLNKSLRQRSNGRSSTFVQYVEDQLFVNSSEEEQALESPAYLASKRESVHDYLRNARWSDLTIPWHLESLLLLGASVCADNFLFLFTFLPIRGIHAIFRFFLSLFYTGRQRASRCVDRVCRTFASYELLDAIHFTIFVVVSVVLFSTVDVSRAYHNIRGQTSIKLYVLFNVMEIFDKLLSSFGQDIFDSLTCSANEICKTCLQHSPKPEIRSRIFHLLVDVLLSFLYVFLHSTMLMYWVVTLNVAINSHNNALLTLLVSNQFVEVKGAVFKAIRLENLFQISCADSVERFQLCVFLSVTFFQSQGKRVMILIWLIMWFAETFIDWIKHAFCTNSFSLSICTEIVQSKLEKRKRLFGVACLSKKIGFVSLPLGCLTIRMTWNAFWRLPSLGKVFVLLTLLIWKLLIDIYVTCFAVTSLKNNSENASKGANTDDDRTLAEKLSSVRRYEFIQGKGSIH
eukprot:jgi/Galph1/1762/GphlegSOOS_G458.1